MRRSVRLGATLVVLGFANGCATDPGDGVFGDTDLSNPGMGGQGNVGPLNQFVPTDWSYLFFREPFGELFDCIDTGLCGHGGANLTFGTMGNGRDSLVYVITSNYFSDDALEDVVVRASGVQRDALDLPAEPAGKRLRLAFEYAFLTSRTVAGDSVVVRVVVDGDTAAPIVLLRIRSSQLGSGIPLRAGGCGTVAIGVVTTYDRCSDWRAVFLDISAYRARSIATQFVAGEGGADDDRGIAFLVRRVRIQQEQ